ncbi:hypothetical protein P3L10_021531 [Capsicum annuum]
MILLSSLTSESRSNYDEMFLFVSEESLCLVDNSYDKSKPIDIWMIIDLSSCPNELEIGNDFVKPMAIRENGKILSEANHIKRLLVSVDDIVEKSKDVDHGKSTSDWYHNPHYVTFYKESLILPDKWTNNCVGDACGKSSDL